MMRKTVRKCLALAVVALVTTGCTNTRQDANTVTLAKAFWQSLRKSDVQPTDPSVVRFAVNKALQDTDQPLALIRFDRTKSVALLTTIERNGPYRTWSTYGTTERRSITSRSGIVTATRGLGGDLMSSSVGRLLRMVTTFEDGIDRQILRHLDGESVIEETVADCAFTPGATENYAQGRLRATVKRVDVFCKTQTGSFSNHYLVTRQGQIVEARQWLGPQIGMGTFQRLQ